MSLSARILRQILLVAGGASLLFGLLFLGLYSDQLARERASTAEQINRLLDEGPIQSRRDGRPGDPAALASAPEGSGSADPGR